VLEVIPADRARLDQVGAVLAGRTSAAPVVDADTGLVRVPVADAAVLPAIIRDFDETSVELAGFNLRKASLDEVFLAITGDGATGGPAGPADETGEIRELERTAR
jgi:oleandomycin transport system ATP-binding protein